jgi:hypothetical protein
VNFTSSPGSSFTIDPGSSPASGAPLAFVPPSPGLLPMTGSSGLFSVMNAANMAASFLRWPRCCPGRSGLWICGTEFAGTRVVSPALKNISLSPGRS